MEGSISPLCLRSSSRLCFFSRNVTPESHRPTNFLSLRERNIPSSSPSLRLFLTPPIGALRSPTVTTEESRDVPMPKIDKNGRLSSPRAARELALVILYAACLEGSDPIRLFEKRIITRREPGYEFDETSLLEYNHMSFGGPPVKTETREEEDELVRHDENESNIEAEVLSAPPELVYSKLVLRFAKKLLAAVADKWDSHVVIIDKISPPDWKSAPAGRILEFSILHLAMSEVAVLGTRHPIVINEAVDLAKRFCDGSAPRIINGCLRTFVKDRATTSIPQGLVIKQEMSV
ncbi:unnamed protein product [Cochlearia groenlandica]